MTTIEIQSLTDQVRNYLRGLCDRLCHLYSRANVFRRIYERMMPSRVPKSVKSVLFVCKGNICRSPLAAAYFQSRVQNKGGRIVVRSAGLETTPGKPAHAFAKLVAGQHTISLDTHATALLVADWINESDLIVVMEVAQKDRVQSLYPKAHNKVVLLGYFGQKGPIDIDDPYSGTMEDFQSCFQRIRHCCDRLLTHLEAARSN